MKIIENQKQFTVADLIEVLQDQDQNLPVRFWATYDDNSCMSIQDENLIFDIREDFSKEFVLNIYTRA